MNILLNNINNNNIKQLDYKTIKTILKYDNKHYNIFINALNTNNSINELILDQNILNNIKIIDIIYILKNKSNLKKIIINVVRKTELKYINEISKLI